MRYQPLIIIGAPRSGTNMLRDVLASLPGVATWPCDEINSIWRHGNVRYPSDEFTPDMARSEVRKYIRRQFDRVAGKYKAHTVVEKTCANSLRVGFVDRVVPEAKYICIRRDGLDVVGSAIKRWKAELDIGYLARKARFVPVSDLLYYAGKHMRNRLYKLFSQDERLALWGPQLEDMDKLLASYSLEQVCALQWQACVEKAGADLEALAPEKWIEVGYEDFVRGPVGQLQRMVDFLGLEAPQSILEKAVAGVSAKSIGKGRKGLPPHTVEVISPLIQQTMARYGYV